MQFKTRKQTFPMKDSRIPWFCKKQGKCRSNSPQEKNIEGFACKITLSLCKSMVILWDFWFLFYSILWSMTCTPQWNSFRVAVKSVWYEIMDHTVIPNAAFTRQKCVIFKQALELTRAQTDEYPLHVNHDRHPTWLGDTVY